MLHNAVNYCPASPDGSDGAAGSSWTIKRSIWCIAWCLPDLPCLLQPESGTVRAAAAGLFIFILESWHVLINIPRKKKVYTVVYTHVDKIHWQLSLILSCQCQACDTCAQIGQASYTGANVASANYIIITFASCHIALTLMDWLQHWLLTWFPAALLGISFTTGCVDPMNGCSNEPWHWQLTLTLTVTAHPKKTHKSRLYEADKGYCKIQESLLHLFDCYHPIQITQAPGHHLRCPTGCPGEMKVRCHSWEASKVGRLRQSSMETDRHNHEKCSNAIYIYIYTQQKYVDIHWYMCVYHGILSHILCGNLHNH